MVHTFQCLGVRIAVDVNSGAVHVLDELTYDLLTALAKREEDGESLQGELPKELIAALPQYCLLYTSDAAICGVNTALPPPATLVPVSG